MCCTASRLKLRLHSADSPEMSEILDWCGIAAGVVLLASVLLAGWEHLQREALEALRLHSPEGRRPPQPGMFKVAEVDVALDAAAEASSDANPNPSHAAMALALSRAAGFRLPRDGSPWLDTCPQITVGTDTVTRIDARVQGQVVEEALPDAPVAWEAEPTSLPLPLPLPHQTTIEPAALR